MFAIQSLSIPPSTLRDLLNFAAASGTPDAAAEIADQAIREWLARAGEQKATQQPARGYQWKQLFLPEGTQLRVWSREGGSRYAEVLGDKIVHAGLPITPNRFVRMQEGIPRNAWTEIWLLMPGETAWKAAHVRRDEQRRTERVLHDSPSPPPSPPPALSPNMRPTATATAVPAVSARQRERVLPNQQAPGQPQRLPRVPPIASQVRIQAAQARQLGKGHWWPGAPERRVLQRRAEDAFLD